MGGSDNKGDGLASQPRHYRVPGQPVLNRHHGGVSPAAQMCCLRNRSGAHQGQTSREGEKDIWWMAGTALGGTGHLGLTHTETQRGRLRTACGQVAWTAKTVKQPRQQPAHPEYANYWVPLTRKRHTMPHSAQPQHTNYWAPRTQKRHQQEHRPQRPTESNNPTQHAKGRTGDCPGPRKGATTRRNVTQGGMFSPSSDWRLGAGPSLSDLKE